MPITFVTVTYGIPPIHCHGAPAQNPVMVRMITKPERESFIEWVLRFLQANKRQLQVHHSSSKLRTQPKTA